MTEQTKTPNYYDEEGGTCNVCGGGIRYGERHYQCGAAVLQLERERDTARETLHKVTTLLRRYRTETPIGHQPHMIAHEVDAVLEGKS